MSTPIGYYLVINRAPHSSFPWSMHGLWPEYKGGDYKHYPKCHSEDININKLILTTMHKHWHSLKKFHHSDYWLWYHEWKKHGACIFDHAQQYFEITLKLFEQIKNDPEKFRYGIRHGDELWYPLDIHFHFKKHMFF